jgi:hypothetical protein
MPPASATLGGPTEPRVLSASMESAQATAGAPRPQRR